MKNASASKKQNYGFWPTWSSCDFSSRQGWLGFDRAHWMHIIPLSLVAVLVNTNKRIQKRASKWTFVQDIPYKALHLALVHLKCLRLFLSINPWSWTSLCCSWADSLDNSPGNFCCCLCPVCLPTTRALVQDPPPPSRLREFPRLRNWPPMRRRISPILAYVT